MDSFVSFVELQRRLDETRAGLNDDALLSRRGRWLAAIVACSFAAGVVATYALPLHLSWISTSFFAIELIAASVFYLGMWRRKKARGRREVSELEKYDLLAVEDAKTIDWIASHGKPAVVRSLETIRERSLGANMSREVFFGTASKIGFIAILGLLITNRDIFKFAGLSTAEAVVRVSAFIAMVAAYVMSFVASVDSVRRDRFVLMFEFAQARLQDPGPALAAEPAAVMASDCAESSTRLEPAPVSCGGTTSG
ncbi:hypothetical protein [Luteibacter sp. 3190]|uniref:hypothetical protein n=1 Tax=Luteibacter sp. 3190 TaxID=2817736 RepID=UPI0028607F8A|nr:hypothetical protein [Luteibacter sp. 3190]MDR6938200.1 hypothetical protein [Luteibacter sp. 3190]